MLIAEVAALLMVVTPFVGAPLESAEGGARCDANVELLPRLDPLVVQTGRIETDKVKCFALFARQGEFVRGLLGGTFAARPLYQSCKAPWSEVLDALFLIHTQEPSRRAAGVK